MRARARTHKYRRHHSRRHLTRSGRARRTHRVRRYFMRGGSADGFRATVPFLPPGGAYVPGAPTNSLTGGFYYGVSPDLSAPNGDIINTSTHLTTPGVTQIGGSGGVLPQLSPAPLDASLPDVMAAIDAGQKAVADLEASSMTSSTPSY